MIMLRYCGDDESGNDGASGKRKDRRGETTCVQDSTLHV